MCVHLTCDQKTTTNSGVEQGVFLKNSAGSICIAHGGKINHPYLHLTQILILNVLQM